MVAGMLPGRVATGAGGRWHSPSGQRDLGSQHRYQLSKEVPAACDGLTLHRPGVCSASSQRDRDGLEPHCPQPSGRFLPVLQARNQKPVSCTGLPAAPLTPQALCWAGLERLRHTSLGDTGAPMPARPSPALAPMLRSRSPPWLPGFASSGPRHRPCQPSEQSLLLGVGGRNSAPNTNMWAPVLLHPPGAPRRFKKVQVPGLPTKGGLAPQDLQWCLGGTCPFLCEAHGVSDEQPGKSWPNKVCAHTCAGQAHTAVGVRSGDTRACPPSPEHIPGWIPRATLV